MRYCDQCNEKGMEIEELNRELDDIQKERVHFKERVREVIDKIDSNQCYCNPSNPTNCNGDCIKNKLKKELELI